MDRGGRNTIGASERTVAPIAATERTCSLLRVVSRRPLAIRPNTSELAGTAMASPLVLREPIFHILNPYPHLSRPSTLRGGSAACAGVVSARCAGALRR